MVFFTPLAYLFQNSSFFFATPAYFFTWVPALVWISLVWWVDGLGLFSLVVLSSPSSMLFTASSNQLAVASSLCGPPWLANFKS
jgi:hypothetical protein